MAYLSTEKCCSWNYRGSLQFHAKRKRGKQEINVACKQVVVSFYIKAHSLYFQNTKIRENLISDLKRNIITSNKAKS